jgi:hypothetical protein
MAAVDEMRRGLVDADLGGGLLKKRIARQGGGKRGGYRTLLASNRRDRWIFLFGFSKNELDNIDDDDEWDYRKLAGVYLSRREQEIAPLIDEGELQEVKDGKSAAA